MTFTFPRDGGAHRFGHQQTAVRSHSRATRSTSSSQALLVALFARTASLLLRHPLLVDMESTAMMQVRLTTHCDEVGCREDWNCGAACRVAGGVGGATKQFFLVLPSDGWLFFVRLLTDPSTSESPDSVTLFFFRLFRDFFFSTSDVAVSTSEVIVPLVALLRATWRSLQKCNTFFTL